MSTTTRSREREFTKKETLLLLKVIVDNQRSYILNKIMEHHSGMTLENALDRLDAVVSHIYMVAGGGPDHEDENLDIIIGAVNSQKTYQENDFRQYNEIHDTIYSSFTVVFWIWQCVFLSCILYLKERDARFDNLEQWFLNATNKNRFINILDMHFCSINDLWFLMTSRHADNAENCMKYVKFKVMDYIFMNYEEILRGRITPGTFIGYTAYFRILGTPRSLIVNGYSPEEESQYLHEYNTMLHLRVQETLSNSSDESDENDQDAEYEDMFLFDDGGDPEFPEDPNDIPMLMENDGRLKYNLRYAPSSSVFIAEAPSNVHIDRNFMIMDMITLDEVSVQSHLDENPDNVVFKISNNSYVATSKERIKMELKKGSNIKYECLHARRMNADSVVETTPYFALRSIGCTNGGVVSYESMWRLLHSPDRVFRIANLSPPIELKYTASHSAYYLANYGIYQDLWVSAAHCQEGQNETLYELQTIPLSRLVASPKKKTPGSSPSKKKSMQSPEPSPSSNKRTRHATESSHGGRKLKHTRRKKID